MTLLSDDLPADHLAARIAVYAALEHVQTLPDPAEHVRRFERWARQAGDAGWPDVRVQVLHNLLVNDMLAGAPHEALRTRADALLSAAFDTGDEVFVARALSGRLAYLGISDPDSLGEDRPSDLARAVAMLDDIAESDPDELGWRAAELAASYNECGQSYHCLALWELEDEMYSRAVQSFDLVRDEAIRPVLAFTRRVVVVNRVEAAAAMACGLLDVGRAEQAREVAAARYRPSAEEIADLQPTWRTDLQAVERLLDALAGSGDPALRGVPEELWDALVTTTWQGYRGCLLLAAAVSAHLAGDDTEAAAYAERSIEYFDVYKPSFRTLAYHLASLGSGESPAARWAAHLSDLRWESRLQVLAAARARLAAERVVRHGDRLRRQALVDELTGLANRHAFTQRLPGLRTLGPGRRLGVVLLDVDEFKAVNDVHGHAVGDEVLRVLGRLLGDAIRPTDLAVRLGGDEFALFLVSDGDRRLGTRVERLVEEIRAHDWERLAPGLRVTVSAGQAVGEAATVDTLMRGADEHLYRAKAEGRDRISA
ncbi:diguanylate cyclase [Kineosporia sp. A_224]|uniref:GGDEF domain-containing protein n=1 Tax=Kineosporia sp. A_224 TaxID=1962180 RepID=UPI000B4AA6CB|nr:GGDEF domain-containing protein [Kineosporia sp. A_224]